MEVEMMISSDSLSHSPAFSWILGGTIIAAAGQFRCFKTKNCAHFTYFMEDKGCHLQDSASTMVYLPGTIAGDAMCTEEEKAKFEEHMRSLPRMGKNDAIPCEETGWRIGRAGL